MEVSFEEQRKEYGEFEFAETRLSKIQWHGTFQNYKKAFHYFQLAAKQGDIHDHNKLGYLYFSGEDTEKNNVKVLPYFFSSFWT